MAKRRPSGDGMVRKRSDGRWEGRIVVGHKENGKPIFRYVYAGTQKELTVKLRQCIAAYQGVDLTELSRITLSGKNSGSHVPPRVGAGAEGFGHSGLRQRRDDPPHRPAGGDFLPGIYR